jgi:hypothetical protein
MKRLLLALVLTAPVLVSNIGTAGLPDLSQESAPIPTCLPCPPPPDDPPGGGGN